MFTSFCFLIFYYINYSSAILSPYTPGVKPFDYNKLQNKSSNLVDRNYNHTKREGIYTYYSKPYYVPHSSRPDEYNYHLSEAHSGYEDNSPHFPQLPPSNLQQHDHDKDLAFKALFAPLLGIALLGVVAAMVNNPVLLQLGVLSGRRRRKRDTVANSGSVTINQPVIDKLHYDLIMIGNILSQMPRYNLINEERRLVDNYFTCSELGKSLKTNENCFRRLVCEVWNDKSNITLGDSEKNFIKMALTNILNNEFTQNEIKSKIEEAIDFGKNRENCSSYECSLIETTQ